MIQKTIKAILFFTFAVTSFQANASLYGSTLCHSAGYDCVTIKRGDTWEKLAPDLRQRDILKRINRMNIEPAPGSVIAVPENFEAVTIYDVSPFPRYIDPPGSKTIYVSQKDLAWGAYDAQGNLVWWGPISPGRSFCPDIRKPCTTPDGIFYVQWKEGINCTSSQFPLRNKYGKKGGAPMPYCVHFWGGYALHGSTEVPGYADSHGCVRMFIEDAQWINQNFVDVPRPGQLGTRVIISEKTV